MGREADSGGKSGRLPMNDAYQVLGVPPTADEAAIRAAYLSMMKQFHPDQPGADLEKAKAVATAYRILRNPHRRATYDSQQADWQLALRSGTAMPVRRRQTGRVAFFLISAATAGLAYVAVNRPLPDVAGFAPPRPRMDAPVAESAPVPQAAAVEPEAEVAQPAAPPLAPAAALPKVDELPLPEALSRPLPARVARAEKPAAKPAAPIREARLVSEPGPAKVVRTAATPSVDLKSLERHQIILYNQSFLAGNEQRRDRLMKTRLEFLKRLEACGSDICRRDTYLSRNQEIATIMSKGA